MDFVKNFLNAIDTFRTVCKSNSVFSQYVQVSILCWQYLIKELKTQYRLVTQEHRRFLSDIRLRRSDYAAADWKRRRYVSVKPFFYYLTVSEFVRATRKRKFSNVIS